jgi:hypothetical protein
VHSAHGAFGGTGIVRSDGHADDANGNTGATRERPGARRKNPEVTT